MIRAHDCQYILILLSYFKQTFLHALCVEAVQISATGVKCWHAVQIAEVVCDKDHV